MVSQQCGQDPRLHTASFHYPLRVAACCRHTYMKNGEKNDSPPGVF